MGESKSKQAMESSVLRSIFYSIDNILNGAVQKSVDATLLKLQNAIYEGFEARLNVIVDGIMQNVMSNLNGYNKDLLEKIKGVKDEVGQYKSKADGLEKGKVSHEELKDLLNKVGKKFDEVVTKAGEDYKKYADDKIKILENNQTIAYKKDLQDAINSAIKPVEVGVNRIMDKVKELESKFYNTVKDQDKLKQATAESENAKVVPVESTPKKSAGKGSLAEMFLGDDEDITKPEK